MVRIKNWIPLGNRTQNYAKRALLDLDGALLCLLEGAFWVLKGALLHSLPKSEGPWPPWPPGSYVPGSICKKILLKLKDGGAVY